MFNVIVTRPWAMQVELAAQAFGYLFNTAGSMLMVTHLTTMLHWPMFSAT